MINQLLVYRPGVGVLQTGEVVQLAQGDILQVSVSFNYRANKAATVHLRAFIGDPADPAAQGRQEVYLPVAEEFISKDSYVNIQTSAGGIIASATLPGTYDLTVRLDEDPDVYDMIPACVTVVEKVGFLASIMNMIPLMMLVMVMGMMMPMMRPEEEEAKHE